MKKYPPFIEKLEQSDNELFRLVSAQHDLVLAPGSLDQKTKFLILLAVDAYASSTGVKNIAEAARKMGATDKEISESLRIAYHIAGNKFLNCATHAFD